MTINYCLKKLVWFQIPSIQILNMRISHYQRKRENLRVLIVVAEPQATILMDNLKNKYFSHLKEGETLQNRTSLLVEFHQGFGKWQIEMPMADSINGRVIAGYSVNDLHLLLQKIAAEKSTKTVSQK